jgi:hypothetical protein
MPLKPLRKIERQAHIVLGNTVVRPAHVINANADIENIVHEQPILVANTEGAVGAEMLLPISAGHDRQGVLIDRFVVAIENLRHTRAGQTEKITAWIIVRAVFVGRTL